MGDNQIGGRVAALDAMRGIAALIVVLCHLSQAYGTPLYGRRWIPLQLFFNGSAAVYVFFVLSGTVLFMSLSAKDNFSYGPYIVKRAIRLYMPLATAILGSALLYIIVQPTFVPQASNWLNGKSWTAFPDINILAGHLSLLDPPKFQTLDNVIWSLIHEIRISVIFPVLSFLIVRAPKVTLAASVLLAIVAFALTSDQTPPQTIDLLRTGRYVFLFATGAWMADNRDVLQSWMAKGRAWVALLGSWALFSLQLPIPPAVFSAGAILVVAAVLGSDRLAGALDVRPLVWLGHISFSLYLIHLPVLLVLSHTLTGVVPPSIILVLTMAAALGLSQIFFNLVERPAISLGRRASAALFYFKDTKAA